MNDEIDHSAAFLQVVSDAVGRMDGLAYATMLRFDPVWGGMGRTSAQARMINGGHLSVNCCFYADASKKRYVIWGVAIAWAAQPWHVQAVVEYEDDDAEPQTVTLWQSERLAVASLEDFSSAIGKAIDGIEQSLALAPIADRFIRMRNPRNS
jgi:hypothetical protein